MAARRRRLERLAERAAGYLVTQAVGHLVHLLHRITVRVERATRQGPAYRSPLGKQPAARGAEVERLNKEWSRVAQEAHRTGRAEVLDELAYRLGCPEDEALQRLAERLDELQRLRFQTGERIEPLGQALEDRLVSVALEGLARVTDLPDEAGAQIAPSPHGDNVETIAQRGGGGNPTKH